MLVRFIEVNMSKIWQILPISIALSACGGGDGDTPPSPKETKTYQFTVSGEVLANNGIENLIDIYAGSIKLGQAITSPEGSYSISLMINEEVYNQAKTNEIRLISPISNIQLVKLSSYKLSDAIIKKNITANISNFSTANYILADLNSNGTVSASELQAYHASNNTELIDQNLIKFATVVTSVIDQTTTVKSTNALGWLTDLKTPANWQQWYSQHQQTFDKAWQANLIDNRVSTEAKRYLKRKDKQLNEYKREDIVKQPQYAATCQLNIGVDDHAFDSTKVDIGQSWQLSSKITDSLTGSLIDDKPKWRSSNSTFAEISTSGILKLLSAGNAKITASYKLGRSSCTDSLTLTIIDTQQPEPAKLTSITIGSLPATLVQNSSVPLKVEGSYSDQSVQNVTEKVTWSASPATAVRFENNAVIALSAGKVTITANHEGYRDTATFTIEQAKPLPPALTTIRIDGYKGTKPVGQSWQLGAFGLYSDKSESEISNIVTWHSSDVAVASVKNGLVTAILEGSATITATLGNVSQQQNITVTAAEPTVNHLTLTGEVSDLNKGESTNLSVLVFYENGTNADITNQVSWSSSDSTIASITNGSLHAVNIGSTTITATWQSPFSTPMSVSQHITVLPAALVSITPDIIRNTITLKEGYRLQSSISFKFSDNSVKTYHEISLSSEVDSSGLPVIKFDKQTHSILAHRSGKSSITLNDIPAEILQHLPPEFNNPGPIKVDVTVEDNPDIYQWHRHTLPSIGTNAKNTQNVIYGDTIYRFWHQAIPVTSDMITQAVLLTTFDGSNRFEKQVVLPLRGLISNQMVDGGGNGYTLLISPDGKGTTEYYIYDLLNGSKHKIDFRNTPFTGLLNDSNAVQPFGFTPEGNLITLTKTSDDSYTAYIYRKDVDDPSVRIWAARETIQGENLSFVQLPSFSDHLVVLEQPTSKQSDTKYHFINRTTGNVDNVVSLQYPHASGQCHSITIIPSSSIDNFGAYCYAVNQDNEEEILGYWLWENAKQMPKVFTNTSDSYREGLLPIAVRGNNSRVIISNSSKSKDNNKLLVKVFRYDEYLNGWFLDRFHSQSDKIVSPSYSNQHRLSETSSLILENPYVHDEQVMMTNHGIVVKPRFKKKWQDNTSMADTPIDINVTEHIFQLNDTWYIFSNTDSNKVWSLQMRNSKPDSAQ